MKKNALTTSLILSLLISFIANVMFFLAFVYVRNNFSPPPHAPKIESAIDYMEILYRFLTNFIISFSVSFIFFKISEKLYNKKVFFRITIIIILSLAATIIISYFFTKLKVPLFDRIIDERYIFGNIFRDAFISLITLFSAQIILLSRKQQQSIITNQKLESENMQTRYQALKNQIDPHFLFNSLNTLNGLIKTDTKKAEEYVLQLSYVFRYILEQKIIINVKDELSFTQSYCNLMKIRYGDNLNFSFSVDAKYYDYEILPLSLQILVENAIKHNVITAKQSLNIYISSNNDDTISVSNKIQAKKEIVSGTKIGLSNLSERYKLMTKREIEISNDNDTFLVKVPIFKSLQR